MLNAIFLTVTLCLLSINNMFGMRRKSKRPRRPRALSVSMSVKRSPSFPTPWRSRSDSFTIKSKRSKTRQKKRVTPVELPKEDKTIVTMVKSEDKDSKKSKGNKKDQNNPFESPRSPRVLALLKTTDVELLLQHKKNKTTATKKVKLPEYAKETINFLPLLQWVKAKYSDHDFPPQVDLTAYLFLDSLKTLEPTISFFTYPVEKKEKIEISLYGLAQTIHNGHDNTLETTSTKISSMITSYLKQYESEKADRYIKNIENLIGEIDKITAVEKNSPKN